MTASTWTLREAVSDDLGGLVACLEAAYADYIRAIDGLPPVSDVSSRDLEEKLVWVADIDGVVAGGLVLDPIGDFMMIENVAVHPDHAGGGLGRALLVLAEGETVRRGLSEMRLSTHADMLKTIAFYKHLGWTETGRHGPKVSMRKEAAG